MASSPVLIAALLLVSCSLAVSGQKFNALFSFGDSMSDTGNLCVNGPPAGLTLTQPPYGETFFGRATCRCSDGRLVVDFLAEKLGLPLLPPSKQGGADFRRGANMAIIGATAMGSNFFTSLGVGDKIWNNGPLDTQIQWFQNLLPSVCGSSCSSYLSNSLFVLGELGGNDYNAQIFGGYTPGLIFRDPLMKVDAPVTPIPDGSGW
jgi:phospholipase/lecithinase/hemolysin